MVEDYTGKLQRLLRTLFQFDSTGLDFGIYRIMNQKREEVDKFINVELIKAVEDELEKYTYSKKTDDFSRLSQKKGLQTPTLDSFGSSAKEIAGTTIINPYVTTSPGSSPAYAIEISGEYDTQYPKTLETEVETEDIDFEDYEKSFEQHKAEIFSHIYQFFSRYYEGGDFVSLQRYSKQQKYAIPHNGEEVMLHWANKDQYFIKTGKNFQNYTFKDDGKTYTIHFRISNAQVEQSNNKNGNRFFRLKNKTEFETEDGIEVLEPISYDPENKELTIFFEYRGLKKEEEKEYGTRNTQDKILDVTENKILSCITDSGLKAVLTKSIDENKNFLRKHLNRYVRENNTDYFIHKDLKGFLTRELDFYIKNEIFDLDDILEVGNEAKMESYVGRVKVFKTICLKIIDFLSQIEEFQKKLFEKKKFILASEYCMTVDNVPEALYSEILQNKAQLEEWEKLYSIGTKNQKNISDFASEAIDIKANPYLVIDTKFFDQSFKDRLLASFDDLDETTCGLMIKSENWQALNLLQNKYAKQIKCIYIDPPYNKGDDVNFPYKDNYQHSCWLTMMENKLNKVKDLILSNGVFYISIGDEELSNLHKLICLSYGEDNVLGTVSRVTKRGGNAGNHFSPSIDYIVAIAKNKTQVANFKLPISSSTLETYKLTDKDGIYKWRNWYDSSLDLSRSINARYEITAPDGSKIIPPLGKRWRNVEITFQGKLLKNEIEFRDCGGPHLDENGNPSKWSVWYKLRPNDGGSVPDNIFDDCLNSGGTLSLNELGIDFEFSKPKELISKLFSLIENNQSIIILDFFAGSGTTAHAVLNLNKKDNGNRKYILIEMGDYFDIILKPRIQKVMYSNDWKDGKPQSKDGQSHIFKYLTLEQYEDTLNNIEFRKKGSIQRKLDGFSDYMLHYMLDFETAGSPCRLNITKLKDPFNYTLKVSDQNELREQVVDLVETFNYLLGIHVKKVKIFENKGTYYRVVYGFKTQDEDEKKENTVVVWRCTHGLNLKEDKDFIEGTILKEMKPYSKVYVNSDFAVEGALPIEPTFSKLMGA
ncbi:Type III restriction-modification system methylation subunit [Methanosarcina mazei C16]|uniref:Type III restriction-modification system methylation subunit n=1 Tax=Methanosarcina mazei C16 TaxID=1434113 RepID=A0A0E3S1E0_METMZ|nr:site-specific DNA-methyltransferase [Methanosarcina mazei]AKB72358.1 Type III restriction-modification system methylation subunit [Methanosarcina mazei C16]